MKKVFLIFAIVLAYPRLDAHGPHRGAHGPHRGAHGPHRGAKLPCPGQTEPQVGNVCFVSNLPTWPAGTPCAINPGLCTNENAADAYIHPESTTICDAFANQTGIPKETCLKCFTSNFYAVGFGNVVQWIPANTNTCLSMP